MEKTKVKIEDVSLGQIKKMVNTVMTKFYGNDSYTTSELIRKVLRKLKCDYSQKGSVRVRTQLRNWIISEIEISKFGKGDSKKGILSGDSKRGVIKVQNKTKINLRSNKKTNKNNEIQSDEEKNLNQDKEIPSDKEKNSNQDNEIQTDKENSDQVGNLDQERQTNENNTSVDEKESNILTEESNEKGRPVACNCTCSCNRNSTVSDVIIKHEIIDLTEDDASIKTEKDIDQDPVFQNSRNQSDVKIIDLTAADDIEIKTEGLDDDMYDINTVVNQLDGSYYQLDNSYYSQPSVIYLVHF